MNTMPTIKEIYKLFLEHPICTDTRNIEEDCLFFALKGSNFNGNKFAEEAIAKGASYAIIDEEVYHSSHKTILVADVLQTLQDLANFHRQQIKIPVIGITGSNGKTTTKELINAVLSKQYKVLATKGNFNNHIGVPLTLLSIRPEHEIAIIEMGTNAPGEIEMLCNIAMPDFGLITSIGKAHLEGLINIDGVIQEKTSLYRYVAGAGGTTFFNADSEHLIKFENTLGKIVHYTSTRADSFHIHKESSFPIIKLDVTDKDGVAHKVISTLYGDYNILNISAALAVGSFFDVNCSEAVEAINNYKSGINRSELTTYRGATVFLDAYNANPSSVRLVINQFRNKEKKQVLVLGDMLELGQHKIHEHKAIVDMVKDLGYEEVAFFGDIYFGFREEYPTFQFFKDFKNLHSWFDELSLEDRQVLLKGSRGMALERLIT